MAQVTGISVDEDAVRSAATRAPNLVDEIGVPRSYPPGGTAAPDLLRAGRRQRPTDGGGAERSVVFEFDDAVVLEVGAGFSLLTNGGDVVPLTRCTREIASAVVCTADSLAEATEYEAMALATAASVDAATVADRTRSYTNYPTSTIL